MTIIHLAAILSPALCSRFTNAIRIIAFSSFTSTVCSIILFLAASAFYAVFTSVSAFAIYAFAFGHCADNFVTLFLTAIAFHAALGAFGTFAIFTSAFCFRADWSISFHFAANVAGAVVCAFAIKTYLFCLFH
jgi:hypothetical protein